MKKTNKKTKTRKTDKSNAKRDALVKALEVAGNACDKADNACDKAADAYDKAAKVLDDAQYALDDFDGVYNTTGSCGVTDCDCNGVV